MMYNSFINYLGFLIPFGTLAIIIFAIAAVIESKSTMKKSSVIRSLYFHLAALITLAIVTGSLIFLVNLGLKTWIFSDADDNSMTRLGMPPTLYLESSSADQKAMVISGQVAVTCQDQCSLTDTQKSSIASWQTSYQSWIEAVNNPGAQRARDAVAGFSFLLVSLPLFFIHFRIVQKEFRTNGESERSVIRPVYFYFVSLGALVMMVVAGGILINLTLKTWVFPSAGQADKAASKISAPSVMPGETTSVDSLVNCGDKCGLDQTTIDLAKRWKNDYATWQNSVSGQFNNTQRQAASTIPFILLGIPLFWYHWSVVRLENKSRKELNSPPPTI